MSQQWSNYQVNDYHRRDLLREAQNERQARQLKSDQQKVSPVYAPLLAKLGQQLVSLGEQLQEQYEASDSLAAEF